MLPRVWLNIAIGLIASFVIDPPAFAEPGAVAHFESIKHDPVQLRRFLVGFPKGGDLHNHIDGAIYAENYIAWAADDGKCVDLETFFIIAPPCDAESGRPPVSQVHLNADIVNPLIDALSVRNREHKAATGHQQFFSTFGRFLTASFGREGDMLAEVSARAARQNTLYLELMQSWGMVDARRLAGTDPSIDPSSPLEEMLDNVGIEGITRNVIAVTDLAEAGWREKLDCGGIDADPGCDVTVRYLAQVIRTFPRKQVLAQTLLAYKLIDSDPRYVGLNFVAPEDNPISLRDHKWQMSIVGELAQYYPAAARGITLHAGELSPGLVPPEHLGIHIREAITIAKARRIGHGVDIVHDPQADELMALMADREIMVEINLTSNDIILGIEGKDHPFQLYRRHAVPLALSTDDEGVSRIDLTHEYQRAVETYDLTYEDLKRLSMNSLQYSFLSSNDKASLVERLDDRFADFEARFE